MLFLNFRFKSKLQNHVVGCDILVQMYPVGTVLPLSWLTLLNVMVSSSTHCPENGTIFHSLTKALCIHTPLFLYALNSLPIYRRIKLDRYLSPCTEV